MNLPPLRYERAAMILTSNRGFAEWGEVFGDPVVATALLDRLLHHAVCHLGGVAGCEGGGNHWQLEPGANRRHIG
jgi:hypothetical protein